MIRTSSMPESQSSRSGALNLLNTSHDSTAARAVVVNRPLYKGLCQLMGCREVGHRHSKESRRRDSVDALASVQYVIRAARLQ